MTKFTSFEHEMGSLLSKMSRILATYNNKTNDLGAKKLGQEHFHETYAHPKSNAIEAISFER